MKKLAILVASLMASVYAYGQGAILFDTSAAYPGGEVRVGTSSGPLAEGPQYVCQLLGSTSGDVGSFAAIGTVKPLGVAGSGLEGYQADPVIVNPGVAGGAAYYVQLHAWNTLSTAEEGFSQTLTLDTLGGTTAGGTSLPPSDLTGLGATVIPVPEPTTIALGLLGAALLLRRRQ